MLVGRLLLVTLLSFAGDKEHKLLHCVMLFSTWDGQLCLLSHSCFDSDEY